MKTCFLIGPMNPSHLPKLHWLKKEVLEKILGPIGFEVFTPDVKQIGDIMNHVIRSADRAELVVADTTGNNPNVLYEIAILDALGRACVPIKQLRNEQEEGLEKGMANQEDSDDKMVFDRAQYRYFTFREQDAQQAIDILTPVIESVLEKKDKAELQENPITQFFGAPLSSMAPTRVMVNGYFDNFIQPALAGPILHGPDFAKGVTNACLEIIIPEKLASADRSWIDSLIQKEIIHPITIKAPGRGVKAFVWDQKLTADGKPVMVDIPTTLAQLTENVLMRLGFQNLDPDTEDYNWLEQDEIQQFLLYMKRKKYENMRTMAIATRLTILRQDECRKPDLFAL
jgi:hypothetical protein